MAKRSAVSARKIEANRINAQRSTGPRTPEGKARSSRNAVVVHGFYSSKLLLDGDDPAELEELRGQLQRDLRPRGPAEQLIVERLVAIQWKLRRLQEAEQRMLQHQIDTLRQHHPRQAVTPADALARMVYGGTELDRLSAFERRLEASIHRCYRELRLLRKDRAERPEEEDDELLPEAPARDERENVRGEPTAEEGEDRKSKLEDRKTGSDACVNVPPPAILHSLSSIPSSAGGQPAAGAVKCSAG